MLSNGEKTILLSSAFRKMANQMCCAVDVRHTCSIACAHFTKWQISDAPDCKKKVVLQEINSCYNDNCKSESEFALFSI